MVRTPSIASAFYAPNDPPIGQQDLRQWIREELVRVSAAISLLAEGHIDASHVAPTRQRDGDIRYADGTDWNPGGGEGIYAYYNSTWNRLG